MVEFPNKKIYLYTDSLDFRCGINTLENLISIYFKDTNIKDSIYLFFSKNRKQIKILEIDNEGAWLYQNKLIDYRFIFPKCHQTTAITSDQLKFILKSLELVKKRSN